MEFNNNGYSAILFVLNPRAGGALTDYRTNIRSFFQNRPNKIALFEVPPDCTPARVRHEIDLISAEKVVAVGGDGTIKLVAEAILETEIRLGIIPTGSANGLAKELNIPNDPEQALHLILNGNYRKIHLISVNGNLCVHLSDIGLNAFMVKRFESLEHRGMWGYLKAAWQVFWSRYRMQIEMKVDGEMVKFHAFMIVMANATRYGTGALINPIGSLDDELFEVIVVRKISFREVIKMWITHRPYHPKMTKVFQTHSVQIRSRRSAHFQVDGEYIGKVNSLRAEIIPHALQVIVP